MLIHVNKSSWTRIGKIQGFTVIKATDDIENLTVNYAVNSFVIFVCGTPRKRVGFTHKHLDHCLIAPMSWARLNIKTVFPKYVDSHVKDKTVVRPSYL